MIRVLIADDSGFMRNTLRQILETDEAIHIAGLAADGIEAVRKVKELKPDVVLLDIDMPAMNGLAALTHIMSECPTPVLVISGHGTAEPALERRALDRGAIEFVAKPSGTISYDIDRLAAEIIRKVRTASVVRLGPLKYGAQAKARGAPVRPRVVIIGASTGGPAALVTVLAGVPRVFGAAILVVQHMSRLGVLLLVRQLQEQCPLDVALADEHDLLCPGKVFIAPGGCHTTLAPTRGEEQVRVSTKPSGHGLAPSVDYAMESAAAVYGAATVGVLLSGIGNDGAQGMKTIKYSGGHTIAQDEESSLIFGMPKAAIDLGCVDQVVPLSQVAETIVDLVEVAPAR